jgi:hypothetical protein
LRLQRLPYRRGNRQRAIGGQVADVPLTNVEAEPLMNAMAGMHDLERFGAAAADQHQMVGKAAEASKYDLLVGRQHLAGRQGGLPFERQDRNVVAQNRCFGLPGRRNHQVTRNSQQLQRFAATLGRRR